MRIKTCYIFYHYEASSFYSTELMVEIDAELSTTLMDLIDDICSLRLFFTLNTTNNVLHILRKTGVELREIQFQTSTSIKSIKYIQKESTDTI